MSQRQPDADVRVTDNPERRRFEAHLNGDLAGVMEYIPLPGKVIATHTETFPPYEGMGVGSQLVSAALQQLRADGRLVQPQCPYVRSYLQRHHEFDDIIDRAGPH